MNEDLHATLLRLRENLDALDQIDADEREQLETSISEIQASLDRFDIQSSDLAKRFHQTTEKFSDNHPHFTRAAGQFADMLSQMGI